MKNYEEKFFLYLKDKMNSQEIIVFEDELKKSEALNNDFEEYKKVIGLIDETKIGEISKEYLDSIITNFRSRLERIDKKKSSTNLRYVFATVLIIIAGYFVVSQFNLENNQGLNQALTELSNEEIDLIANDFYDSEDLTKNIDDVSSQKIYSLYAENLKTSFDESVGDINSRVVLSKYNITDVDQYLSDDDIELIYTQLIEKKIL